MARDEISKEYIGDWLELKRVQQVLEDDLFVELDLCVPRIRPIDRHHDHDVLEDGQFLLLHSRDHYVDHKLSRGNRALQNWFIGLGVVNRQFHLREVADVLSCVGHQEIEVKSIEGVEEVEGGAVKGRVPLQLERELDVFSARGDLKNFVALIDTLIDHSHPLALAWDELGRDALDEGGLVVRQLRKHRVLRLVSEKGAGEDVAEGGILTLLLEE